jgi:DNA ligase (NAD+)
MDLSYFQKAYYEGSPVISDTEYDYLVSVNQDAEKHIGPRGDVPHLYQMYSLQKYYPGRGDVLPLNIKDYVETPKLDGNAVELVFFQGELVKATTRGDGAYGTDITEKMDLILGTSCSIERNDLLQITGEVVATQNVPNARNLAAGALNTKDMDEFYNRMQELGLEFVAYGIKPSLNDFYHQDLIDLGNEGFFTPLSNTILELVQDSNVKTDGTVYRLNKNSDFESLGYTSKFPRGAFAVKVDAEYVLTKLIDVSWETGRSGKVTPTAILEPINIDGATIQRATLNNVAFIQALNLSLGDTVRVIRSGDIIPTIIGKE